MLKSLMLAVPLSASLVAHDAKLTDITGTWVIEIESHQLGLEVVQKDTTVEGTLYAMGDRIP